MQSRGTPKGYNYLPDETSGERRMASEIAADRSEIASYPGNPYYPEVSLLLWGFTF